MTEIEDLKTKIASLEAKQKGVEVALFQLALVLSSHAGKGMDKVAHDFERLLSAHKDNLAPEHADFYAPSDRILGLLKAAANLAANPS